jgi:hypothetical protein
LAEESYCVDHMVIICADMKIHVDKPYVFEVVEQSV